jgi:hypothetical protein
MDAFERLRTVRFFEPDVERQVEAIRREATGRAEVELVVLLDAFHVLGPRGAIAALERLDALPARMLYVTDDRDVLAWARVLDRRRGWVADLRGDVGRVRSRWWRGRARDAARAGAGDPL